MDWCTIRQVMCAPFAPIENTNIHGQTIFRDMFGYITWIKTRTIRNSETSSRSARKGPAEADGAEVEPIPNHSRCCSGFHARFARPAPRPSSQMELADGK